MSDPDNGVPQIDYINNRRKFILLSPADSCTIFIKQSIHRCKEDNDMATRKLPRMYTDIQKRYKKFSGAVENLGKTARKMGPLNAKTSHLIQIAAAAAIRSEGAVHSHVRRALESGAKAEEIYHALILLTSTIGFPAVSAAMSWADDVIRK